MSDADPRVAVVMITHNRRDEVLRTLSRLTDLPEQPPIVVVDNGSTDDTAAAVSAHFPRVDVLPAGGNLGAAGRNLGARQVGTPYVAFCDDDTWWEPGSLRRAADLLDAYPRLAVANARVLLGADEREDPICQVLERSPLPPEPGVPGRPLLGFLAGASVVRRSAFLQAGGFDPKFFVGGEEELLALDLNAAGWVVAYVPELTVHHHPSAVRDGAGRRWHVLRNALWCAWLRRSLPGAVRKTWDLLAAAPWDRVMLRSLASALAGVPWVLWHRRVLPPGLEAKLRLLDRPAPAALVESDRLTAERVSA